jgi:acyl carrier protein
MKTNIHQEIRKFIAEFFLVGQENGFANSDSLLEKGILDSTGVLELVAYLEKTFAIKIGNDEILPENLDSVDAIAGFLERKNQATIVG